MVGSLPEQRGGCTWERVVEDGELVVGRSTVCVGSANLTKSGNDAATARKHEVDPHTQSKAGHQLHAELRLYVQVSLHETHGLENATCHSIHKSRSASGPPWTPHAHYLPGLYGVCGNEHSGALNTITAV